MRSAAVTVALGLAAALVPWAGAASAPAEASTPRCTIVGTSHADRLVGTSHRDVICGGGGNDVLVGRGGDDVLLGGRGRDDLTGGHGADLLEGGAGNDSLSGQGGADRLLGGSANDTADGGTGRDHVSGGPGNDDLTGGPSADDVDGGGGTNWCSLDPGDTATGCVYDRSPALATELSSSTRSVDVSAMARRVTVSVHVTDDTGVTSVRVSSEDGASFPTVFAEMRSGDVRDGWWRATVTVPRYSTPGSIVPQVLTWDRVGRSGSADFPDAAITVRDDTPDVDLPSVTLLSPTADTVYDVRRHAATLTMRAHIVDQVSGATNVVYTVWQPLINGAMSAGEGGGMRLVSGTVNDGIWQGGVTIPTGSVGGSWNLTVSLTDNAHLGSGQRVEWWGPQMYAARSYDPVLNRPFPDDAGSVTVLGRARTDDTAPEVSSVVVTPAEVDTLPGPADVAISVDAGDAGSGVAGVYAELLPLHDDGHASQTLSASLSLSAGDPASGTWSGTLTLPQGIPPDTYFVKIITWDTETNMTAYMASGHPDAALYAHQLAGDPTVTVVEHALP